VWLVERVRQENHQYYKPNNCDKDWQVSGPKAAGFCPDTVLFCLDAVPCFNAGFLFGIDALAFLWC
jgi:hypothetical protein